MTIIERSPSIVQKDLSTLRELLDAIFKLMIDIDNEIDNAWLKPKEGFKVEEDEEDDDSVAFGKTCVDRLVSAVGEE